MAKSGTDYTNWFVVQVRSSREEFIKSFIDKYAAENIRMIIFSRELIFERKHKQITCLSPLFPGYIFIYKNVKQALDILKRNKPDEWVRPVCFKDHKEKCLTCFGEKAPCMVYTPEMEFLLNNTDKKGIIHLSSGIQKEGDVKITGGPLQHLHSQIIWINQRKNKVCVEINLFNRKMKINLGIDILNRL